MAVNQWPSIAQGEKLYCVAASGRIPGVGSIPSLWRLSACSRYRIRPMISGSPESPSIAKQLQPINVPTNYLIDAKHSPLPKICI